MALELLAARLWRLTSREPPSRATRLSRRQVERLHEARAIMAARMQSPPSLLELSREVALGTTLLKAGFRQVFGETIFEYLRALRLEKAKQILAGEGASVKEAAAAVGYNSFSHFSQAFRAHVGIGPRAWAAERLGRRA
jgi:AraC family transcriptional regulator, transcriptional activator of the genes for pyochelin and ferripyochelin receptors